MVRLALAALLLLPLVAAAAPSSFDERMGGVVEEYLRIHQPLAADRLDGVSAAAHRLQKLVGALEGAKASGPSSKHAAQIRTKLAAAVARLVKAQDLPRIREAFKEVSRPIALWITVTRPAGLNVVYCSMAKGSWVQRGKPIRNPYYGSKMLACGEVVGGADKGHAGGHMGK